MRIRIADPDNRKRYDINYLRTNSLEEVIDIVEFMTGQRCEVVRGKQLNPLLPSADGRRGQRLSTQINLFRKP